MPPRRRSSAPPQQLTLLALDPAGNARLSLSSEVDIALRFRYDQSGRLTLEHVGVTSEQGVSSRLLHQLPIPQMEALIRQHLQPELVRRALQADLRLGDGSLIEVKQMPRQRRLALVAGLYEQAQQAGSVSPAPVIAERLGGIPIRTIHSWIAAARKEGLLPPGRQGRAG